MRHCAIVDQPHRCPGQHGYYAVDGREQVTQKWGSKHEEVPSFDLHAVILEVI